MARARTYTRAVAVPRLVLIKIQIAAALKRGADITPAGLKSVKSGLDRKWLKNVLIHGFDRNDKCRAELAIEVDWATYNVQVSAGHDMIEVSDGWDDNVAPEIGEMLAEFIDFCVAHNLRREWRVTYSPGIDTNMIDRELGFSRARPFNWAASPVDLSLRIRELSEVSTTIRLVSG